MARAAALVAAALCASCKPALHGLCETNDQCRAGTQCAAIHICLKITTDCPAGCGSGEFCSGGVCNAQPPVLTVQPPAGGFLGPAHSAVTVGIQASKSLTLTSLTVEVDAGQPLLTATLPQPQAGDNAVVLANLPAGFLGQVTLVATLQFIDAGGAPDSVRSVAVPAALDTSPPTISSLFLAPGQGGVVNGWADATGADLDLRAQVDDGAQGSGAQSAVLALDACPAQAPCRYQGTLVPSQGAFSFLVPRAVQAAGSEAPVAAHVTAVDAAGNSASIVAALQIDGKPPALGAPRVVTAGATGEDGNAWFAGGAQAAAIEVAVPMSDQGAGLDASSVLLRVNAADVDVDPGAIAGTLPGDGAAHFSVPASAVRTREGAVRFTVAAADKLGHAAAPASGSLYIDAVPPQVALAQVDYANAQPASACGAPDGDHFTCGRTGGRALRDDTVSVTFVAYDCGAGLATSDQPTPASFSITTGGQTASGPAGESASLAGSCASSANARHQYQFTLDVGNDLPALDPADAAGVVRAAISAAVLDRLGHRGASAPVSSTAGGDGVLSVVTWRWKRLFDGLATGAPALTSPGGSGLIVLGVATSSGNNVVFVRRDGGLDGGRQLAAAPVGEVMVGNSALYASLGSAGFAAFSETAILHAFAPGNANFSTPPALSPSASPEVAFATPTRSSGANLYSFTAGGTQSTATVFIGLATPSFAGVTQGSGNAFVAHSSGFTSWVSGGSGADYSESPKRAGLAPPALVGSSTLGGQSPLFPDDEPRVQQADFAQCPGALGSTPCWKPTFTGQSGVPGAPVQHTPVFDGAQIVATDSTGLVTAWDAAGGKLWSTVAPVGPAQPLVSPPVLLAPANSGVTGAALVVSAAGEAQRLGPPIAAGRPTLTVLLGSTGEAGVLAPFGSGQTPPFALVEESQTGKGGVAYFTDGAGWLFALQLDDAPQAASKTAWPRPSRDTCNSRSADSNCQ